MYELCTSGGFSGPTRHFASGALINAPRYGVSPRLRLDIVRNDLVAWAWATGRVYVKSDGTPWRPIVHVEDIIEAIRSVAGRAPGPGP